jgi:hypothetical protein
MLWTRSAGFERSTLRDGLRPLFRSPAIPGKNPIEANSKTRANLLGDPVVHDLFVYL